MWRVVKIGARRTVQPGQCLLAFSGLFLFLSIQTLDFEVGCILPQGDEVVIYVLWWQFSFATRYSSHRLSGVLFLDELPEFQPAALEILRQPLEDSQVHISRAAVSVTYPSRFMLVCAMNPCKCGWYGHPKHPCTCTQAAVEKYRARISGPLLDRIDLYADVPAVSYGELSRRGASESSVLVRARVNAARARQEARAGACNARLSPSQTKELCVPDEEGRALLKAAFDRLGLTGRAYDRILRVARTIADLAGNDGIAASHLAEALQYRNQTPKGVS
ncbi:MAG: ATP-binding protein [Clostridia bacterium]|nr:ATP-binding protein [Clostridia bacterium]